MPLIFIYSSSIWAAAAQRERHEEGSNIICQTDDVVITERSPLSYHLCVAAERWDSGAADVIMI